MFLGFMTLEDILYLFSDVEVLDISERETNRTLYHGYRQDLKDDNKMLKRPVIEVSPENMDDDMFPVLSIVLK